MNFINDKEKMRDFKELSKLEFLNEYSYLTEKEYDETFVEYIKELTYEIAIENEEIDCNSLGYILQNSKNEKDVYVLMSDFNNDRVYFINVFNDEKSESTPEWDFSFMDYLYDMLADGYEIKWMSENVHPVIWSDICEGFEVQDIKEDIGMQKYIKYCIDNEITQDKVSSTTLRCNNLIEYYIGDADFEKMQGLPQLTRLAFLEECKEMALHNISVYSEGNFISKAKSGYEKEFDRESQKLIIINKLIDEEKQKIREKENMER